MGLLINENEFTSKSTSPKLIGETFTTLRTGIIDGAVECDGSQYNFSDFDSNLQALFDDGKLPYLPIGKFDEMVTNQGGCDSFGYGTNELTLYPLELYQGSHYGTAYYSNVYDWETIEPDPTEAYILHGVKIYDKDTHEELVGYTVRHHPLIGYDQWQLHNENDEYSSDIVSPSFSSGDPITLPTGGEFQTTTYFKVPKKLSRVLVRSQKPTADNNYTWYNVYADGWCEQGGYVDTSGGSAVSTTYPIELKDAVCPDVNFVYGFQSELFVEVQQVVSMSTTGFTTRGRAVNDLTKVWENSDFYWRVVGYAASTEYTKDKWNYQNVNYERHMIQLK